MRAPVLKLRVLATAMLLLSPHCPAQSNVYSLGVYSGGVTSSDICSLMLPLPPHKFRLTQHGWRQDANGHTVMDFRRTNNPAAIARRFLAVECDAERFVMPLDFLPQRATVRFGGTVTATNGTNDLTQLVVSCVTNRGGHFSPNQLPAMPMNWRRYSRENLDVIVGEQCRFAEWRDLLERSYGKPETTIRSDVPLGNGRSIIYTPQLAGITLVLTDNSTETIITVIGRARK